MSDALNVVEASTSNNLRDVVILPPDSGDKGIQSDEDEIDDENFDIAGLPQEVTGEVELHESDTTDEESDKIEPKAKKTCQWRKDEDVAIPTDAVEPEKVGIEHAGKSEYEIFLLFWTEEILSHITYQTNLYATRDQNQHNFKVNEEDISQFLGLLLISGYHSLPKENDCWSTAEDMEAPIFSKTMSRESFRRIKRYIHVADNNNLENSKVAKVLPIYNMLKTNLLQFGIFHKHLSIDEAMVPYYGHHSAKMFIKNKPIRFGFKIWMLCGTDGYPYNMEIYCGKSLIHNKEPLGTRVVKNMLSVVQKPSQHVIFFDNFFSSHALFHYLSEMNIRACGTVRENRTNKCPLIHSKSLKKHERGSYDYKSDGMVICVKWNDNAIVTLQSNHYGVTPLQKVSRRVKGQNKTDVIQPNLIRRYNEGMGGVDLLDRLCSSYRPKLRQKKWWWNLFSHALNLAVVAAFRFYQHVNNNDKITHLEFRRTIAVCLIKVNATQRKRKGGPTAPVVRDIRLDGINHIVTTCSQGRCSVCQKNTRLKCSKCDKRLHKNVCFELFHKK